MKWSRFIYKTKFNDYYLMLNTLNTAIVALDLNTYKRINELLTHISQSTDEELNALADMGFIFEDEYDEIDDFYCELIKEWEHSDSLKIVLLGTTACNMACEYCYENGIERNLQLTPEILKKFHKYVTYLLDRNDEIKSLYMLIFGGEPTLCWKETMSAVELIENLCDKRSVEFKTGIVTNGYLLSKEKILDLKRHNCDSIQITLDGPENVHNQRRKLKNGKGSFKQIIDNMHTALSANFLKCIDLRINIDKENIFSVEELLSYLSTEFSPKQLDISLGITCKTVNSSEKLVASAFSPSETADSLCALFPVLEKYGFKTRDFYSFDGICVAKTKNSFVLNPDGTIYRCISMVGRKELALGSIDELLESTNLERIFEKNIYESCIAKKCEFLPLCHTGCKFDAIVDHGSIEPPSCKYDLYCAVNAFLLKNKFQKEEFE